MKKTQVQLRRTPYDSAKLSVMKGSLFTEKEFEKFLDMNFDEIFKYLSEHGFSKTIDKSFLKYEGFYLVERVLNDHLSTLYKKIINSASKGSNVLLEQYYFKYQIHNFMVLIRCKLSKEQEIEPYLIGDSSRRSLFIKAYELGTMEEIIRRISRKLRLSEDEVLTQYREGLFELENYLYKEYYKRLSSFDFKFNNKDEKEFTRFIRKYVDLINARTYLKIKNEDSKIEFKEVFLVGGMLSLSFFEELKNLDSQKVLEKFAKEFSDTSSVEGLSTFEGLDSEISRHKEYTAKQFQKIRFGSPFYAFKFLFEAERQMAKLRIVLKAKHLGLSKEEVKKLI